ncbi:MAG TPA: stage III sporulation protein AF [Lachnospiraceae bacterium]|nr:stage III sporulation protein AF [Lachnospiraceae bacterium]
MADQVIEMIKKLGIFIILSQTIVHFCPNNSYERYIRMLVGIMIISLVIIPIGGMFFSQAEFDYATRLREFEKEYDKAVGGVEFKKELNKNVSDKEIIKETEEKVKSSLNNAIQEINKKDALTENSYIFNFYVVSKVEIQMVEDNTYLLITMNRTTESLEKIKINKIQIGVSENNNIENIDNKEVINILQQFFAKQLGIQESNLEVICSE